MAGGAVAFPEETMGYEDQWRCGVCKTEYVVPTLARECEARHHSVDTQGKMSLAL